MKEWNPEGVASRRPGTKKIMRSPILSIGPNEQWSIDGHDKLNSFGIGIWGIRDVYSGLMLAMQAMPSNRRANDVHCVYLNAVIKAKGELALRSSITSGFPMQLASDRGSEIGEVVASQTAFR